MSSDASDGKRAGKSASAFRTISEVSEILDVPQHVLRFWETKFSQVKPLKRAGGRRYYRPEDLMLLQRIRDLLYSEGYTIKGVQKLFREKGVKTLLASVQAENQPVEEHGSQTERPVLVTDSDGQHDLVDAIAAVGGHPGGEKGMPTMDRMELHSLFEELTSIHAELREYLDR